MDNNVNPWCAQGETPLYKASMPLGQKVPYAHKLTAGGDLLTARGGHASLVMNDSGSTLLPGRAFRWKDGYYGLRIGGYAGAGEPADGFIDHTIPAAGVATGNVCLAITEHGTPVYAWTDGANALAKGDYVKTANSGKLTKDTGTPTTNGKAGNVEDTTIAATADLRFWCEFQPH